MHQMQCPNIIGVNEAYDNLQRQQGGAMQPLTIHLKQEIDRLNYIIRLTQDTLHGLRLAISGLDTMVEDHV